MGSRHFWVDGTAEFRRLCDEAEAREARAEKALENEIEIPGYPQQVWAGWVWVTGNARTGWTEHGWSKRDGREDCERVVREVVERLGVADAFDLEAQL